MKTHVNKIIVRIKQESEDYNAHLRNLSDDHKNLCDAISSEQTNLKRLTEASASMDSEIEAISEEKQKVNQKKYFKYYIINIKYVFILN